MRRAASSLATRRSESALANLVQSMLLPSGEIGLGRLINGTLMKWSFLSAGANSSFGARSTAMVTFLIFWFNLGAILAQRNAFSTSYSSNTRPRVVITDKLGIYSAALKSLAPGIDQRRHAEEIAAHGRMAWQKTNDYGLRSLAETGVGRVLVLEAIS